MIGHMHLIIGIEFSFRNFVPRNGLFSECDLGKWVSQYDYFFAIGVFPTIIFLLNFLGFSH